MTLLNTPPERKTYLVHYGVKGQRWGVRRTPRQLGHVPEEERRNQINKDRQKIAKKSERGTLKVKRGLQKVSDEELQTRINRMEMEKKYIDLATEKPPALSRGQETALSVLGVLGKSAATQIGKNIGKRIGAKADKDKDKDKDKKD